MGFAPCVSKKIVSDIDTESDDNIASQSLEEGEAVAESEATPTSEVAQTAADLAQQAATKSPSKSKT